MSLAPEFAVVGGSYAGLSAALQLARARRRVLVIDAGQRRNRFVDQAGATAHGFLGHDGRAPAAIAADARAQLLRYESVSWIDGVVDDAGIAGDGRIQLRVDGRPLSAGRLILATGVQDVLPPVPGLAERWGASVFHCPYCHGHEAGDRIGVVAASAQALHQALMLPDWGSTTLFLNGSPPPDAAEAAALARRGTSLEATPILRIEGHADVVLADGRRLPMSGLFTQPRTEPASPLAEQLGCTLVAGPMGRFVQVGEAQATGVPNVFACGDMARGAGNIALAVADGVMAALGAHRSAMGL